MSVWLRHCEKRDSACETKRIGATVVESSVLFLVASVSSLEENVFLRSLPDSTVNVTPSQSQGSHVKLQKRIGTFWLQADRRVTDDKASANEQDGFSSVQMAPIQEIGVASSPDVADGTITECCRAWKSLTRGRAY